MGKFLDDTALEAIGENRWRANLQKDGELVVYLTVAMFSPLLDALYRSR